MNQKSIIKSYEVQNRMFDNIDTLDVKEFLITELAKRFCECNAYRDISIAKSKATQMIETIEENVKKETIDEIASYFADWYGYGYDSKSFYKWLKGIYPKAKVDWSKVSVDTPILVRNNTSIWEKRYFAKYENGKIYTFPSGATKWSWDGLESSLSSWTHGKLALNEDPGDKLKKW